MCVGMQQNTMNWKIGISPLVLQESAAGRASFLYIWKQAEMNHAGIINMTYVDAAHKILEQARQPLHYRELTERVLAQGLIQPSGLTPDATMAPASILTPSRRTRDNGTVVRDEGERKIDGLVGFAEKHQTRWRREVPDPLAAKEPKICLQN